jgi:hypothetical protein
MADTKHPHAPVEGDGISYRGIVWFVVVLALVTVTCQLLIWVLLRAMQHEAPDASTQAAPLAPTVQAADRPAVDGRIYPGMSAIGNPESPAPKLLVNEPANLDALRAHEREVLTTYGVADPATGTYRIPIDRAKDLLLQRGLPVREAGSAKDAKAVKEVMK